MEKKSSATSKKSSAVDATKKGTTQKNVGQTKKSSTANSAKLQHTYPKLAKRKRAGRMAHQDLTTGIKQDK